MERNLLQILFAILEAYALWLGTLTLHICLVSIAALAFEGLWDRSMPASFGAHFITYSQACCLLLLGVVAKSVLSGIKLSASAKD